VFGRLALRPILIDSVLTSVGKDFVLLGAAAFLEVIGRTSRNSVGCDFF
jgi:hypothetical protein